ncbi:MAG TPA: hypothetical protein DCR10_07920 [Acidimicrobiaceae bacterium]|nr:hypothetical protein [Acidimicrobiaceae bacterium]
MSRILHLARRFVLSIWPCGPGLDDEAWARESLLPAEVVLWARMSGHDRRHAVAVARRVDRALGGASRPILAAALLHDVGKIASGLSVPTRVVATLCGLVGGQRVWAGDGRISRYLRHPEIGAEILAEARSDAMTIAWTAEHHLSSDRWTVDRQTGEALRAADDD